MPSLRERKQEIRARALARRRALPEKAELSAWIGRRLAGLPEYRSARTLLVYVGRPSEVHTRELIGHAQAGGKRIAVPCCVGDELELFCMESLDELVPRTLGILEPTAELLALAERRLDAARLDLVVVPGVAFDRQGGRVGYGRGYFDRLLARARPETPRIALAFECQIFDQVPMGPGDVFMDKVVTESAVYERRAPA